MDSNSSKFDLTKKLGLVLGFIASFVIFIFADLNPEKPEITATLAVATLMAIWWVTEAIPIAITALLPVVLFPVLGIMNGKTISTAYFNHVIFLFIMQVLCQSRTMPLFLVLGLNNANYMPYIMV